MHHERPGKSASLVYIFVRLTSVISHCGFWSLACGSEEGHETAKAEACDANTSGGLRQLACGLDSRRDIRDSQVAIEALVELESLLRFRLIQTRHGDSRLDA